jgi:hypothetical protein
MLVVLQDLREGIVFSLEFDVFPAKILLRRCQSFFSIFIFGDIPSDRLNFLQVAAIIKQRPPTPFHPESVTLN